MKKLLLLLLALAALYFVRSRYYGPRTVIEPQLRLSLTSNAEISVPFTLYDSFHFSIKNCEEEIHIKEISYSNDSVFFKLPVFGTEFKGELSTTMFEGEWHNYLKSETYTIPCRINLEKEFIRKHKESVDFSGTYRVEFKDAEGQITPAIAHFALTDNEVCGTFQTETGDYRYLSGRVSGKSMELSTFDGSHAFYFIAAMNEDETLDGVFRSGTHWVESWTAEKDLNYALSDMKKLTYLKEGFDKLAFSKPDIHGDTVTLEDSMFQNKVVIVQVLATWCPNCMDESRFLAKMYEKYHSKGLEIIGLDFEKDTSFGYYQKRVKRFSQDLNIEYPILLGGPSNKHEAQKSLPMLNKILSYPTAIFLDRNGEIVEIHTGFAGPGTGKAYKVYIEETESLIQTLLN
jgi:thiol-disulfide isomerase/thioredoxin